MGAQKKPTPRKTTKRPRATASAATEVRRVLVEMAVPTAERAAVAFQLGAAAFQVSGFQADTGYAPVPLSPEVDKVASFEAARRKTVLVRGTLARGQEKELLAQENVENVWLDTPIAPFDTGAMEHRDFVETVGTAAFGPCPIPTCDCPPLTAKGTISDVANYLGVDQIWAQGYQGQGIVIGVVDGGLTTPSRVPTGKIGPVIGGPKTNWGMVAFWGGHGEMSATDALGMAPQAQLYDIRLPDSDIDAVGAVISDAIAGYQWAINRHQADGTPHILTNSWGIYQKSWDPVYATDAGHPFTRKVVDAINEGILILFAAGNCGEACPSGKCGTDVGPGKSIWGANGHPLVMTVGAANIRDQWVGYSSQGPASLAQQKPDFCSITHFQGYYAVDNGTSAACPVAAGVVALLKQCKGTITQSTVKSVLKATAKNIGPGGWDPHSGSGIIQAKAAFDRVCPAPRPDCGKHKDAAVRCLRLYRSTRSRRYLCYFRQHAALYYRCLYLATRKKRYLCLFYRNAALYHRCMCELTRQQSYCSWYRRYLEAYRKCR